MEILETCLPKELEDRVEATMLSSNFPWFFNDEDSPNPDYNFATIDTKDTVTTPQFTHKIFSDGRINSRAYILAREVLDKFVVALKINVKSIMRIKANLLLNHAAVKEHNYNTPHIDARIPHHVLLYYVNDSDGDTVIFDEKFNGSEVKLLKPKRVSPSKGKAIYFDGGHYHASCNPIISRKRAVINFDLFVS